MLNIELVVPKLCITNINIERRRLNMILALSKLSTTNRGELHTFSHRFKKYHLNTCNPCISPIYSTLYKVILQRKKNIFIVNV